MKKLQFKVEIQAPADKVWRVLWDDANYRAWSSVFTEGSHAVTDWKEGSKVHFLDGKGSGMYGKIARNIPGQFMSFQHIGEIKGGVEQPVDEKTKEWSGGTENYTLETVGDKTVLVADLDAPEPFLDYFNAKFPLALGKIREIAEG